MTEDSRPFPKGGSDRGETATQRKTAPVRPVIGRRTVLAGAVALAAPLLAMSVHGRNGRRANAALAQSAGRAIQPAATPIISPAAVEATPRAAGALQIMREPWPSAEGEPRRGGTLRLVRTPADRTDFSPARLRQDFQVPVSYLDPLVRPDEATLEPRPWLAERWVWSDDGRVVTFTVREGVRWHDGEPLTADDVRFSFLVYRDDIDSAARNLFVLVDDVEAVDDRTVRVTLTEPDGGFVLNAATQLIFQRDQYVDHWESRPAGERTLTGFDWREGTPLGTGPWRIANWDGDGVEFERNDDYWAGPPYFERMTLTWEERGAERIDAWRAGEVDLLWPLRPTGVDDVADRPGRLYVADAASVMFAAFNFDNPARLVPDLFDDPSVRRALSLAIDRGRYAREVFGGFVRPEFAGTVAQPWANDPGVRNPPRDLAAARRLLEEAGWEDRDGDGLRENIAGASLAMTAIVRNDDRPELFEVLQRVKGDLEDVGVALRVLAMAPARFQERWLVTRDFDLIAYAYDLYPGFTDFDLYGSAWDIRVNPQGWNPGGYRNEEVDEAIEAALGEVDLAEQREALVRLQRATNDDLFALWFGFAQELILASPDLRGFRPNTFWQTADTRQLWRAE